MRKRTTAVKKRKLAEQAQYTAKIIAQESIPIIDKSLFEKVYPAPSTSGYQQRYGVTEAQFNALPKPHCTQTSEYSTRDMSQKPEPYIIFKRPTKAEIYSNVEYDMDDEDVAWLQLINELYDNRYPVEPEVFEFLIDRLEKESRFCRSMNFDGKLIAEISDEEAVCSICTGGQSYIWNQVLFCDLCNISVHQVCYGVPYLPEGPWLCRRCYRTPSKIPICDLCPKLSGAFKETDSRTWCHVVCAVWIPEVHFSNPVFLDPICNLENIPVAKWNLQCSICNIKGKGACVRCKSKNCRVAFHVTCAQQAGYAMMMNRNSIEYKKQNVYGIFCLKHTETAESKSEIQNTNFMKLLNPNVAQILCSSIVISYYIPPEKIKEIANSVTFDRKNKFIQKLLPYWYLKRFYRQGVPMIPSKSSNFDEDIVKPVSAIRDQQMDSQTPNQEDEIVEKQQVEEQTDEVHLNEAEIKLLKLIRQSLEKARLSCEMVKKREKIKSALYLVSYKYVECKVHPLLVYLRKLTEHLMEMDTDNLFCKTEDDSESLGSKSIDFHLIMEKVNNFQYSSFDEYNSDFQTMLTKCLNCHGKRSRIYKSAAKLREKSREKLITASKDIADIQKQFTSDDKGSDCDLPEPLSPQGKEDTYENPKPSDFATEIDYYGTDPEPSTNSFEPICHKRKCLCSDPIESNIQNTIELSQSQPTIIGGNLETKKSKTKKSKLKKF